MALAGVEIERWNPPRKPVRQIGQVGQMGRTEWTGEPLLRRWLEHPASQILHHERRCCDDAKRWFLAYARSMEMSNLPDAGLRAPVWLSRRFTWGPSEWPISWCGIVDRDVIDCGVFACLAREIFAAQGHSVHPAQVLLRFNEECTYQWRKSWETGDTRELDFEKGRKFPWIGQRVAYHEICVIEEEDGAGRFYDSTWGHWFYPHARDGHGSVLAIRSECPRLLRWGDQTISCGEWVVL